MSYAYKVDVAAARTATAAKASAVAPAVSAKVISLATRAPYQEPSVKVFPIDGMVMTGTLTTAGNVGIP